jgi:hypothetical protein
MTPEQNMLLVKAFVKITEEFPRSLREHPPEEWAAMTPRQMFFAVQAENHEYLLAEAGGDMDGEHGMIAESVQCAVVAIRRVMELERRRKDNGTI